MPAGNEMAGVPRCVRETGIIGVRAGNGLIGPASDGRGHWRDQKIIALKERPNLCLDIAEIG